MIKIKQAIAFAYESTSTSNNANKSVNKSDRVNISEVASKMERGYIIINLLFLILLLHTLFFLKLFISII